jgi:tetratricopeptide (TPR) repeat protein
VTQRPCLSAEELADFLRGVGAQDDKRHVASCDACTRRVSLLRRSLSAGAEPITDIVTEVDELVTTLLAAPRGTWWKRVLEPEYRRADIARRLLSLCVDARLRDRPLAVEFAKAATAIVDRLVRDVPETADLRFEAWKFYSAVLREAGRYAETEVAFTRAEAAAPATSDPELSQASMLLSRALFCAELDVWKPEEATALLDRAEPLFARHDASRLKDVVAVRGLLLFRAGDIRAAYERFSVVLETTPRADREGYLNALMNVTCVRVELRDINAEAEQSISLLIAENMALGRAVQVARARWMMGKLHVLRGNYDAAVDLMRAAMDEIGDSDSWIRIGLDTIEALLLARRDDEVQKLLPELAVTAITLDDREPSRRQFAYARTVQVRPRVSVKQDSHNR